jgi:protein-S-isoprenylcysteine O-methyltransferase Ste14
LSCGLSLRLEGIPKSSMKFDLNAVNRSRLDQFEQLFVLLLYGWLVLRVLPDAVESGGLLAIILLLLSEGAVVILLLFRRPTADISIKIQDWIIAAAGTWLPLMVIKGGEPMLGSLGPLLLLLGLVTQVAAKFTLLRSFGLVAANRGVKINGMYAFVRHPMYAGYMLTHIGYLLASPSLWNVGVYVAVWAFLIARMVAEENILGADPEYRKYAQRVRHRIVPGVF